MFTGKTWDGVSTKGRKPVFRIQGLIEKALFGGKENRAFLVKFACCGLEPLRDREAFSLCGKSEGGGTAWRLVRPTDNVRREGIVIRIDNQSFFRVDVPLTHRGRSKVDNVHPGGSEESTLDLELEGG